MMSLTHMQAQLLDYITWFQQRNEGVSPSFDEMRETLGLASKSGVHRLVTALEERGRIVRKPNRARCIEIVPEDTDLHRYPTQALIAELSRRAQVNRKAA